MSAASEYFAAEMRPMAMRDLERVLEIERASYAFPWTHAIFRDCLRVGYECHVLELDERVIAYSVLSTGAGEAHLLNLCVIERWRRCGYARLMLEHALARSVERGARRMFLEVRPSNAAAIALYETFGFERLGRRRGYYQAAGGREDALVLARALDSGG